MFNMPDQAKMQIYEWQRRPAHLPANSKINQLNKLKYKAESPT